MSDLLPPNATPQERALSLAMARLGDVPVPIRSVPNPATCPPELLAWLSWEESVDDWSSLWSEDQKRAIIKASLALHQQKGTAAALKIALESLGYDIRVREWFNQTPIAAPYTFSVYLGIEQTGVGQREMLDLFGVITRTKNLRSHLDKVEVNARTVAGPCVAAVVGLGHVISVANFTTEQMVLNETTLAI